MQYDADELGVGVDIVEINRFRSLGIEAPFYFRVYTSVELAYCERFLDPYPHLAVIFAAKEAVLKSLSVPSNLTYKMIEIQHGSNGCPHVKISYPCSRKFIVSLSHSQEFAIAIAVSFPSHTSIDINSLNDRILALIENELQEVEMYEQ